MRCSTFRKILHCAYTDTKSLDVKTACNAVSRVFIGADTKSRTRDLLITNQLLYQLSYAGVDAIIKTEWLRSKPRSTAGQKSNAT